MDISALRRSLEESWISPIKSSPSHHRILTRNPSSSSSSSPSASSSSSQYRSPSHRHIHTIDGANTHINNRTNTGGNGSGDGNDVIDRLLPTFAIGDHEGVINIHHANDNSDNNEYILTLTQQLTLQMEQNSALISQLESREIALQQSQHDLMLCRKELSAAQSNNTLASEDSANLSKRYHILHESMEIISTESQLLQEKLSEAKALLAEKDLEMERLNQKYQEMESHRQEILSQNSDLQVQLHQLQYNQSESGQETRTMIQRLNFSLDQSTQDINNYRRQCHELEIELTKTRDQTIALQRENQRLSRVNHEHGYEKDRLLEQLKGLEDSNDDYKRKYLSAHILTQDYADQIDSLKALLAVVDNSSSASLERVTKAEDELIECKELQSDYEEELASLRQELLQAKEKIDHCVRQELRDKERITSMERSLQEEYSRNLDSARIRIDELSLALKQSSEQLHVERVKHQESSADYFLKIAETNQLLTSRTADCQSTIDDLERQRSDLAVKVRALEEELRQCTEEHSMAMRAEQDAVHSTLAQLNATRQDMLAHNERHIFVLAAVQTVVHELAREAKDLQHQIAFIAQQQQKLSSLVRQMNTKAEEGGPSISISLFEPLANYGAEVSTSFDLLVDMVTAGKHKCEKIAEEIEDVNKRRGDLRAKLLECEAEKAELNFQLRNAFRKNEMLEESIVELRASLTTTKDELSGARRELSAEKSSIEVKLAELVRTNCSLQAEITRMSSDSIYVRTTFDSRLQEEQSNCSVLEQMIAKQAEQIAALNAEKSQLQSELVSAETKLTSSHYQFQRLHKDASELVERAVNEKKGHMQREASLREAVTQYQQQLLQTQRLLATVQSHREQLMKANANEEKLNTGAIDHIVKVNMPAKPATAKSPIKSLQALKAAVEDYSAPSQHPQPVMSSTIDRQARLAQFVPVAGSSQFSPKIRDTKSTSESQVSANRSSVLSLANRSTWSNARRSLLSPDEESHQDTFRRPASTVSTGLAGNHGIAQIPSEASALVAREEDNSLFVSRLKQLESTPQALPSVIAYESTEEIVSTALDLPWEAHSLLNFDASQEPIEVRASDYSSESDGAPNDVRSESGSEEVDSLGETSM